MVSASKVYLDPCCARRVVERRDVCTHENGMWSMYRHASWRTCSRSEQIVPRYYSWPANGAARFEVLASYGRPDARVGRVRAKRRPATGHRAARDSSRDGVAGRSLFTPSHWMASTGACFSRLGGRPALYGLGLSRGSSQRRHPGVAIADCPVPGLPSKPRRSRFSTLRTPPALASAPQPHVRPVADHRRRNLVTAASGVAAGVYYRHLVKAVVASVPSNLASEGAHAAEAATDPDRPARDRGPRHRALQPDPVERIDGPDLFRDLRHTRPDRAVRPQAHRDHHAATRRPRGGASRAASSQQRGLVTSSEQ